ncbi:MAG: hypothetical protein PHV68_02820 [Candidatus Gastranaerophilales bacterium]|nr:hypothetical protein [Candidatus Gastranaerophilales bacterium]
MNTIPHNLEFALTFWVYTTIIISIIIAVFLIKFLVEASNLTKSLNEISTIIKHELEPVLIDLRTLIESVSSVVSSADKQVSKFSEIVKSIVNPSSIFVNKAKDATKGLLRGVITGLRVFLKSNRRK